MAASHWLQSPAPRLRGSWNLPQKCAASSTVPERDILLLFFCGGILEKSIKMVRGNYVFLLWIYCRGIVCIHSQPVQAEEIGHISSLTDHEPDECIQCIVRMIIHELYDLSKARLNWANDDCVNIWTAGQARRSYYSCRNEVITECQHSDISSRCWRNLDPLEYLMQSPLKVNSAFPLVLMSVELKFEVAGNPPSFWCSAVATSTGGKLEKSFENSGNAMESETDIYCDIKHNLKSIAWWNLIN